MAAPVIPEYNSDFPLIAKYIFKYRWLLKLLKCLLQQKLS